MKLPFDLGVKLFFRLLLPGFLLTLGLLPILFPLLDAAGLQKQKELAFVLATILNGWLMVAADMPVYMLLEGRRYSPAFILSWLRKGQDKRLGRINRCIEEYYRRKEAGDADDAIRARYVEASVKKRSYPLDKNGERYARSPTRLGNTITSFESYGDTRYGLDDAFYWPRIWINLNKDLREEIDNQQAMADSTVYSTVALATSGALWAGYGALNALEGPVAGLLYRWNIVTAPYGEGIFRYLPDTPACFLIAAVCLLLSRGVYLLAIFTNEQYGNIFTAVIDTHATKMKEYIDVEGIAKKVTDLTGMPAQDDKEKFEIVRRYLQYYIVKVPDRTRPLPFPKLKKRRAGVFMTSLCRGLDKVMKRCQ